MSLIQRVAVIVEDLGEATADDVCREIGWEVSRKQVVRALQNARYTGLLDSDGRRPLATYRAARPRALKMPAPSVWAYAEQCS